MKINKVNIGLRDGDMKEVVGGVKEMELGMKINKVNIRIIG